MRKLYLLLFIIPWLISCSSTYRTSDRNKITTQESNILDVVMAQYAHNIEQTWGKNEIIIPNPKEFLEYSDDFKTRSFVNFAKNRITFETINDKYPSQALKNAIVTLLLLPDYHSAENNNSDEDGPFLLGQVLNEYHQTIRTKRQAVDFADYLLKNAIKYRYSSNHHKVYYVTISLVLDHLDARAKKYLPYIQASAKKYGVNNSLILSIIEVESEFNPYAVSSSSAIGLMQVQAHTAGKDVYQNRGRSGQPSKSYLLDPRNNIDIGTAYLAILKNNYLKGITNPQSMRYAIIASYNGGAGSVLRVFSKDRKKAIEIINKMTPSQVYKTLETKHPSAEARRYLYKVVRAQDKLLHPTARRSLKQS